MELNLAQKILVLGLRAYQRVLSPVIATLAGPAGRCRFEPCCSEYAIGAVRGHGAVRGFALAAWRVLRCNPWGGCGSDPVPEKHSLPHAHSAGICGHHHN
jgi:putative membrane protein insertion efficiency factor